MKNISTDVEYVLTAAKCPTYQGVKPEDADFRIWDD